MEQVTGIEPASDAWEAPVLPLNYTCIMVEVTGLEPAASASRTQRSTKLSHTSISSAKADECYYSESTPKSQGVFKFTSKMQVRITLNNPTITK